MNNITPHHSLVPSGRGLGTRLASPSTRTKGNEGAYTRQTMYCSFIEIDGESWWYTINVFYKCMHDMVSIQNEYLLHFTLGNEVFNRASVCQASNHTYPICLIQTYTAYSPIDHVPTELVPQVAGFHSGGHLPGNFASWATSFTPNFWYILRSPVSALYMYVIS